MPRRSAGARAPTPTCSPNCCAARAIMTPRSSRAPSAAATRCWSSSTADPGVQYRFASVELPGLDAAGAGCREAAQRLRRQGRRSGHRAGRDRRRRSADDRARRGGFRRGEARRAAGRGQSPDASRDADSAGDSGAGRSVRRDPRQRPAAVQRAPRRHHRAVQARRPVPALEDRRSAPGADRDDAWWPMPTSRWCRWTADASSTSTFASSPRRRTRSPARSATAPGRAFAVEGELDRPQLLQSRRRADACAASSARKEQLAGVAVPPLAISCSATRRSTCRLTASHQKFDAYEARTVQHRRPYRAAEQLHLAEEMDVELRRAAPRDRRARRVQPRGHQGHADLLHRRASAHARL